MMKLFHFHHFEKAVTRVLLYFVVVMICLFTLYPYFVMLTTSLKSRQEIFSMNGTLLPITALWSTFIDIWQKAAMARYLLNTIIIAGGLSDVCPCGAAHRYL